AAERTKTIRLTSAVTVLSSDVPVRVFQQFATLDLLSDGRAEIMAGRGSFIESFPLYGYDLADYDRLFAEKLEELLAVRADPEARGVYPRPLQDPLPVWVAVGGTPESAARAGLLGLPMALAIIGGSPERFAPFAEIHRRAAEQAGRPRPALSINSHGFVAPTGEEAADIAFPGHETMMNRIGRERGWPPLRRAGSAARSSSAARRRSSRRSSSSTSSSGTIASSCSSASARCRTGSSCARSSSSAPRSPPRCARRFPRRRERARPAPADGTNESVAVADFFWKRSRGPTEMLKRSFARGLLLGGGALWFVRWVSSPTPGADAPVEAAPVALDVLDDDDPPPAAVAPVHRRSLKRRFATTLALTTIFFAGAALAAGAGNELAQVSPDSTVADAPATVTVTTTDAATPTTATDDTTTTDAATSATDSAAVPAPQAAAAAAADVTTPAATPTTTEPVTTDAPTTDATTTTTAATTVAAVAPADPTTTTDPSDVVVKPVVPVHAVQPADTHRRVSVATAHVHRSRSVQSSLPLPVPLAIPYHAIAFDPQEWLTENPGTPTGIAAVDIAMNYLGVPY